MLAATVWLGPMIWASVAPTPPSTIPSATKKNDTPHPTPRQNEQKYDAARLDTIQNSAPRKQKSQATHKLSRGKTGAQPPVYGAAARHSLRGGVRVDGSSTVFVITEAVTEEFRSQQRHVRVAVGASGTGGGFKKFIAGEIDITAASRPVHALEKKQLKNKNIDYIQIPVAVDAIVVAVHPNNTWVNTLSVAELKKLWQPGSRVKTWKDLRPQWPDRKINLYGPGPDSGTFDYFTLAINGKARASRSDFMRSEDDNVLVHGVAQNIDSLGYFSFAYYKANQKRLKAVAISRAGHKPVKPSFENMRSQKYAPLTRPVYIYVNRAKLKQSPQVKEFVSFYLQQAGVLAEPTGYIPLQASEYQKAIHRL